MNTNYADLAEVMTGRQLAPGPRILHRLPGGAASEPYRLFTLTPQTNLIGAEISGVDLRQPVGPELFAELDRALLEWKVLFFRDQQLSCAQHRDFARLWGELEVHPFLPHGDVPEIVRFAKDAQTPGVENAWHTDVTWRERPAMGAVLRAVEVPPAGGDTLFADMAAAYDNLPAELRERIDGLRAVHDFTLPFRHLLDADELARRQAEFPPAEHPVVRRHPDTGRKTLFVNAVFTTHITDLDPTESETLLRHLFNQARIPEYQVRFHWTPNAIAFWDNRATQHYAVNDYHPHPRTTHRATIQPPTP